MGVIGRGDVCAVLCCTDEVEGVEQVLLRCGAYVEERRKLCSVLVWDGGRWLRGRSWWGGGGARVSTFLCGEEKRWIGF